MAKLQKIAFLQDLDEIQSFITEEGLLSKYFNITDLPLELPMGKSSMLIMGSPALLDGVILKIELVDSLGYPVYIEPVYNYSESGGVRVGIEVYKDTAAGAATLTILGELDPDKVDENIPDQWRGTYNVKYTRTITINKSIPNDRPIRFFKRPRLQVFEIIKGQVSLAASTTGSNEQTVGTIIGTPVQNTEGSNFSIDGDNYQEVQTYADQVYGFNPMGNYEEYDSTDPRYTITIADADFSSSIVGGAITIDAPNVNLSFSTGSSTVIPKYTSRISNVVNKKTIEVQKPYGVYDSGSGFYRIAELGPSSYKVNWPKFHEYDTSSINFKSFADIRLSKLRNFSGDVHRIAGYVKNNGPFGNWSKIIDTPVESPELLLDPLSITGTSRIGFFNSDTVATTYWTATGGKFGVESATTVQTYSSNEYLTDSIFMSGSNVDLISDDDEEWIKLQLKDAFKLDFIADTEYKLRIKLVADNTEGQQNTIKAVAHMSGSAFGMSQNNIFAGQGYGRAIGMITHNNSAGNVMGAASPQYETVFTPDSDGTAVLQLRFTGGYWSVSEISVKPNSDTNFSPEYIRLIAPVPPLQTRPDYLDFAFEFYDINNNKSQTVITSLPDNPDGVKFDGENMNILGNDNLIGGSVYVGGDSIGAGIQFGGVNSTIPETGGSGAIASGFIRSVKYQGFTSASQDNSNTGFMIYSGSVLPDSGDDYSGVGLELVGESGSFRFGTNPSRFEVIADAFFVGSTNAQFISGSGGNIEISSSAFHLTPAGDVIMSGSVTATEGYIGDWQIIEGKLSGSNATLDADGAALYKSDAGPDSNPLDGYYIDFTPGSYYVRFGTDFAISSSGQLFASGAKIEGVLTSSEGYIGNWTIAPNTLHYFTDPTYTGLSSAGDTRFFAGATSLAASGSAPFNVKASGDITGSNVLFTGGKIAAFNISDDALYTDSFFISASATNNDLFISASNFNVSAKGDVSASDIYVSGGTTVGGDIIGGGIAGWSISATSIVDDNNIVKLEPAGAYIISSSYFQVSSAGEMTASAGKIAGFEINGTQLKQGTSFFLDGASDGSFFISSSDFQVTPTGQITASEANITGDITANTITATTAGNIANFTVASTGLTSTGVGMHPAGQAHAFTAGTGGTPAFSVTHAGQITASAANITGDIVANTITANTTGTIANFDIDSIEIASSNNKLRLKSSGQITASAAKISGSGVEIAAPSFILDTDNFDINSTIGTVALGTTPTLTGGTGVFMSSSGEFRLGDPSSFLSFVNDAFTLAGSDIEIDVTDLNISSSGFTLSSPEASMSLGNSRELLLHATGGTNNVPIIKLDGGEISASNFFVSTAGEITASAGTIGGWSMTSASIESSNKDIQIFADRLAKSDGTGGPGFVIRDQYQNDVVSIISGSLYEIGAATDEAKNDSFEDDPLNSFSSDGYHVGTSASPLDIVSWSFSAIGPVSHSITKRTGANFTQFNKALVGDSTFDVVRPGYLAPIAALSSSDASISASYAAAKIADIDENQYTLIQEVSASSQASNTWVGGNVISFAFVGKMSHSLAGAGYDRGLESQKYKVDYWSTGDSEWKQFIPASTGSDGFGAYDLATRYTSIKSSNQLPESTHKLRIVLSGSINSDIEFKTSEDLYEELKLDPIYKYMKGAGLLPEPVTGSAANVKPESAKYPYTELSFDNFRLVQDQPKIQISQTGFLLYQSENSYLKMTPAGMDMRSSNEGGMAFGKSVTGRSAMGGAGVFGRFAAPKLQAYDADPNTVEAYAFAGNTDEYARGNHAHILPFDTLDDVIGTGTLTGFTSTGIDDNADQTVITIGDDEHVTFAGNIILSGTVDGVDIFTRDAVLTSTTTTADSALQPAHTMYVGTTSIAFNRANAALTLAGITLTTPSIAAAGWENANHTHAGSTTGGQIAASAVSDFDTEVANNTAVAANTLKVSDVNHNVTTNLSVSRNGAKIDVVSSDGTNAVLPLADTDNWGVMSDEMFDEHEVNNAKVSDVNHNVTTNLSVSRDSTKIDVVSSDGTNAVLPLADTDNWGVMSDEMFDEHEVNNAKVSDVNHNVTTNLSVNRNGTKLDVISSDGTNAVLPLADTDNWGVMSDEMFDYLYAIEPSADVTDEDNVRSAGALMDDEVDADIKTLSLPASTTISTFGASLIDDVANSNARTTLGLGTAAITAATAYATSTQGSTADSALQPAHTMYIGTTSIAFNRANAALTLAGITLTTPNLGTPSTLVGTNISGTAANLTVGATTGVEAGADVTDATNVEDAGALMDSELTSIADVKALNQSVVSGATPTFTTTNFTDASNKRLMTDAQETLLDSVESGATADQTAAEILTAIKTVDGAGSGLDADLLDGQTGTYYTDFSNITVDNDEIPIAKLASDNVNFGGITVALGASDLTPAFALADATGLPISTGVSGLASGVATFLATPTSANLISAVTNETGTGALVFANSPTLVTPVLGTPGSGDFSTGTFTWPTFNQSTTGNASTVTTNANLTGDITSVGNATTIAAGVIIDADVKSDAAIAYSKLGSIPTWNQSTTGNAATVTTNANLTGDVTSVGNATTIAAGVIIDADVKSDAAIAYSKLGTVPTWNQNTTGTAANATLAAAVTVTDDSSTNTDFAIPYHNGSNALLDDTGVFTYNPSTQKLIVPNIDISGTQTFVNTATLVVTSSVTFEGESSDDFETNLGVTNPTADRTITLPNADGNVVLDTLSQTLTNKTLTTPTIASFANATHTHANAAGGGQITLGTGTTGNYVATAVAGNGIDVSGATGNVTISIGSTEVTNAMLAGSIANSKLSNSTVSYGGIQLSLGGSDATPAFALADATGLPIVAGTTGTLSVARGGTGVTTSTGTGNVVLSASPTLTGTLTADAGTFSGNIASTGTIGGVYSAEKSFTFTFLGGAETDDHQKANIELPVSGAFWGTCEISIASSYWHANAPGVVTKTFGVGLYNGAFYTNESRYSEVLGTAADHFAIGEWSFDSANFKYYVPLVHRSTTQNVCTVRVRWLGAGTVDRANMEAMTISSVYTTDTTVYAKPEVEYKRLVTFSGDINANGNIAGDGSTAISSMASLGIGSVTATGTVQAEQITSTDDITASGTVQAEHLYSTDDAQIDDDLTVSGDINANGDIVGDGSTAMSSMASLGIGTVTATGLVTSVGLTTTGAITATDQTIGSGAITSTGLLTGVGLTTTGAITATGQTIGSGAITSTGAIIGTSYTGGAISGTTGNFTGDATFSEDIILDGTGDTIYNSFISGIMGTGWRIDYDTTNGGSHLEIDNITVRNTLQTHIFQKGTVKATNGYLYISDSGVISGSVSASNYVYIIDEKSATFIADDRLWFKSADITGSGTINSVKFDIAAVTADTPQSGVTRYTVDNIEGDIDNLTVGGTVVKISGGSILLDASSANGPYMDIVNGLSVSGSATNVAVRTGNLAGITTANAAFGSSGTLSGFGMWASGSVYLEGGINATEGLIAGWSINDETLTGGNLTLDKSGKIITTDGSNERVWLGLIDANPHYGLKIFDGVGTGSENRLVELGSGDNMIAGWNLVPGNIQSNNTGGSVRLSSVSQSLTIWTGSMNEAEPKLVLGKLPLNDGTVDSPYGFAVFSGSGTVSGSEANASVLITANKARLAGWDLSPGSIKSDNTFGSVRLSSTTQALTIWTGSINEAEPKLVLGKLPLNDGTVDSPYGFAVFSGSGTVSGSEANASILITANKARLAGWDLSPGKLESGTVAVIDGNQGKIALGTNATLATSAAPSASLFFVSASADPIFYVGQNFSYVSDVLTAGGWTIGSGVIESLDTDGGIKIDASNKQINIYTGSAATTTPRIVIGDVNGSDSFGIKGVKSNGNTVFEISETQNIIAGWTINAGAISKNNVKLDSTADAEGLYVKKTSYSHTTAGAFLGLDSGTAKFNVGDSSKFIKFDGSDFIVDAGNFSLDSSGNMIAESAQFSGSIQATGGKFTGNVTAGTTTINAGGITGSAGGGFRMGNEGLVIGEGSITLGSNFSVDSSGNMNASNAKFSGSIKALSGHFAGDVTAGTVTIGTGGITGSSAGGFRMGNEGLVMTGGSITLGSPTAFTATSTGQVTGSKMLFKGGSIGGMTVTETQVHVGTDLVLNSDGQITASAAKITGKITGTSGAIGGWTIKGNHLSGSSGAIIATQAAGKRAVINGIDNTIDFYEAEKAGLGNKIVEIGNFASYAYTGDPDLQHYGLKLSGSNTATNNNQAVIDITNGDVYDSIAVLQAFEWNASNIRSHTILGTATGANRGRAAIWGEIESSLPEVTASNSSGLITGIIGTVSETELPGRWAKSAGITGVASPSLALMDSEDGGNVPPGQYGVVSVGDAYISGSVGLHLDNFLGIDTDYPLLLGAVTDTTIGQGGAGALGPFYNPSTYTLSTYLMNVIGNLTVGGTVTLGDAATDVVTVTGDLKVDDYARIDALRVGVTSTDPGDGNLWVEGGIGVNVAPNATDGTIYAGNNIVAYASDRRLKENIKTIENPLEKVLGLEGVTFNWNELAEKEAGYDREERITGLLAQDLQKILPEAVKIAPFDSDQSGESISGEKYLTIQYERVVPLLVESIKEMGSLIGDLESRIEQLEGKE